MVTKNTNEVVLSKEMIVAAEIYHKQIQRRDTNFTELVETLKPVMKKKDVAQSLDMLMDWFIVRGEYGAIKKGNGCAYLYLLTDVHMSDIKEVYETYWKSNRKKYLKDN